MAYICYLLAYSVLFAIYKLLRLLVGRHLAHFAYYKHYIVLSPLLCMNPCTLIVIDTKALSFGYTSILWYRFLGIIRCSSTRYMLISSCIDGVPDSATISLANTPLTYSRNDLGEPMYRKAGPIVCVCAVIVCTWFGMLC